MFLERRNVKLDHQNRGRRTLSLYDAVGDIGETLWLSYDKLSNI